MTEQSYQPQVNLAAYETAAKQKWRFGMLVALAVLGVFGLVYVYYRWFGDILPAASNEASVSTSDTTAEKPRHPIGNQVTTRAASDIWWWRATDGSHAG